MSRDKPGTGADGGGCRNRAGPGRGLARWGHLVESVQLAPVSESGRAHGGRSARNSTAGARGMFVIPVVWYYVQPGHVPSFTLPWLGERARGIGLRNPHSPVAPGAARGASHTCLPMSGQRMLSGLGPVQTPWCLGGKPACGRKREADCGKGKARVCCIQRDVGAHTHSLPAPAPGLHHPPAPALGPAPCLPCSLPAPAPPPASPPSPPIPRASGHSAGLSCGSLVCFTHVYAPMQVTG